jgi:heme oxygenase
MESLPYTLRSVLEAQSLRHRIKVATQSVHDKLDSDPAGLRLMSREATRADYAFFLARTLGFMRPIEALLFSKEVSSLALPFWKPTENRVERIESDLCTLGISQATIDALPTMAHVPSIKTVGHLMGVSYVIEGSMMGGLVMAKPVRKTLGLEPHAITFFLPCEPKGIIKKFESFAMALDSFAKCDCDEQDAMDAASETFTLIAEWFKTATHCSL